MKIIEYFNERISRILAHNNFTKISECKFIKSSPILGDIEVTLNNGDYRHKGSGYKVTLVFLNENLASSFLEDRNGKFEIISNKDVISIEKFSNLLFEINNHELEEKILSLYPNNISAIQIETPKFMGARLDKTFSNYKAIIWYDKNDELYKKLFTNETKEELLGEINNFIKTI